MMNERTYALTVSCGQAARVFSTLAVRPFSSGFFAALGLIVSGAGSALHPESTPPAEPSATSYRLVDYWPPAADGSILSYEGTFKVPNLFEGSRNMTTSFGGMETVDGDSLERWVFEEQSESQFGENEWTIVEFISRVDGLRIHEYRSDEEDVVYDPPLLYVPETAEVGESFSGTSAFTEHRQSGETQTGTVTYVTEFQRTETITVPGGTFDTVVVAMERTVDYDEEEGTLVQNLNFWLVDGIGPVRMEHYIEEAETPGAIEVQLELVDHTLGDGGGGGTGTPLEEFYQWAEEIPDEELRAPDASAAGDAVPNLVRFALGAGPFDPVRDLLPTADPGGEGEVQVRLYRDANQEGVSLQIEVTDDLLSWKAVARSDNGEAFEKVGDGNVTVSESEHEGSLREATVTDPAATDAGRGRYFRLQVEIADQ